MSAQMNQAIRLRRCDLTPLYDKIFLAPEGECQRLFGYKDGTIHDINSLESWPTTTKRAACEEGWIACTVSASEICVARYSGSNGVMDQRQIYVPSAVSIECIEIDGSHLYAGGAGEIAEAENPRSTTRQPWVGYLDLSRSDSDWESLIGSDLHRGLLNKCVDAFALSPNHLIAFDNVVMPLYAIRINRGTDQSSPRFDDLVSLRTHTTYEKIHGAAHNDRYIAYLSSGINHGTSGQYVSVSSPDQFPEELSLFSQYSRGLLLQDGATTEEFGEYGSSRDGWRDIDLCDSHVVFAAGDRGLGIADIARNDGVAYYPINGHAAMVTAMPAGSNEVAVSVVEDGRWTTTLIPMPIEQLADAQRQSVSTSFPSLVSLLERRFHIRYGLTKIDLLPKHEAPIEIFIRDGFLHLEPPHRKHDVDAWRQFHASVFVHTVGMGMDIDPMSFSSIQIQLGKYPDESVCTFLSDCLERVHSETSS